MNIQPKTITKETTTSFSFTYLSDKHRTNDNPDSKSLMVFLFEAEPQQFIEITGDEYDALGQWTDSSLNEFLIAKYGLTKIEE